jgi:hypothetical protein
MKGYHRQEDYHHDDMDSTSSEESYDDSRLNPSTSRHIMEDAYARSHNRSFAEASRPRVNSNFFQNNAEENMRSAYYSGNGHSPQEDADSYDRYDDESKRRQEASHTSRRNRRGKDLSVDCHSESVSRPTYYENGPGRGEEHACGCDEDQSYFGPPTYDEHSLVPSEYLVKPKFQNDRHGEDNMVRRNAYSADDHHHHSYSGSHDSYDDESKQRQHSHSRGRGGGEDLSVDYHSDSESSAGEDQSYFGPPTYDEHSLAPSEYLVKPNFQNNHDHAEENRARRNAYAADDRHHHSYSGSHDSYDDESKQRQPSHSRGRGGRSGEDLSVDYHSDSESSAGAGSYDGRGEDQSYFGPPTYDEHSLAPSEYLVKPNFQNNHDHAEEKMARRSAYAEDDQHHHSYSGSHDSYDDESKRMQAPSHNRRGGGGEDLSVDYHSDSDSSSASYEKNGQGRREEESSYIRREQEDRSYFGSVYDERSFASESIVNNKANSFQHNAEGNIRNAAYYSPEDQHSEGQYDRYGSYYDDEESERRQQQEPPGIYENGPRRGEESSYSRGGGDPSYMKHPRHPRLYAAGGALTKKGRH